MKPISDETTLGKWLVDLRTWDDPLVKPFRELVGAKPGQVALLSEPLLRRLQDIRNGRSSVYCLARWLDREARAGHKHVMLLKLENAKQDEEDCHANDSGNGD